MACTDNDAALDSNQFVWISIIRSRKCLQRKAIFSPRREPTAAIAHENIIIPHPLDLRGAHFSMNFSRLAPHKMTEKFISCANSCETTMSSSFGFSEQ